MNEICKEALNEALRYHINKGRSISEGHPPDTSVQVPTDDEVIATAEKFKTFLAG